MKAYEAGIISLIPPLIAIILAFITKEVIFSLFFAAFVGSIIYECYDGGNFITVFTNFINVISSKATEEVSLLIFILLMGGLVEIMKKSGSTQAYSRWISGVIKSKRATNFFTFLLGLFLFVDDYFNCLSNGTIMRPVADTVGISPYKISYIIKGMAINCALVIPISSWGAAILSQISMAQVTDAFSAFIRSIPYCSLPLLFFIFLLIIILFDYDFGQMAARENQAKEHCLHNKQIEEEKTKEKENKIEKNVKSKKNEKVDDSKTNKKCQSLMKATVFDLIFPILILIITSILLMLYSGGFFDGKDVSTAFSEAETTVCLSVGTLFAIILCFIFFLPRKLMPFLSFMDAVKDGIAEMMSTILLLVLAWSLAYYSNDLLGTGQYIGNLIVNGNFPGWLLPIIVYIFSGFLAFSLGNAWVTFSIFIPLSVNIIKIVQPSLLEATIGACLSGSSFGELASPISDTTILTAAATGVNTALFTSISSEYNFVLGIIAGISYIFYGTLDGDYIIGDCVCIVLLIIALVVCKFLKVPKLKKSKLENDVDLLDIDLPTKDINSVSIAMQSKMGEPIDVDIIEDNHSQTMIDELDDKVIDDGYDEQSKSLHINEELNTIHSTDLSSNNDANNYTNSLPLKITLNGKEEKEDDDDDAI
ncbi:hypothetical protein WA158_005026 [Blastocystis sp. Blastoise]